MSERVWYGIVGETLTECQATRVLILALPIISCPSHCDAKHRCSGPYHFSSLWPSSNCQPLLPLVCSLSLKSHGRPLCPHPVPAALNHWLWGGGIHTLQLPRYVSGIILRCVFHSISRISSGIHLWLPTVAAGQITRPLLAAFSFLAHFLLTLFFLYLLKKTICTWTLVAGSASGGTKTKTIDMWVIYFPQATGFSHVR